MIGYLQKFLFTPERARTKVKSLSGGERCRLLLARLFTRPANVLVLDEPTNDLDIETLELLEELLLEFKGTLLLVSHDRAFLNNVVTSTLVFSGEGKIEEYVGGYDDWLRQKEAAPVPVAEKPAPKPPPRPRTATVKMSFKEERELEALPPLLEQLEAEKNRALPLPGRSRILPRRRQRCRRRQRAPAGTGKRTARRLPALGIPGGAESAGARGGKKIKKHTSRSPLTAQKILTQLKA